MARAAKGKPGPLSKEVAAILRAQIARKQLRQTAIAEAAGVSQTQLSDILNAHKHLDLEQLDRICVALGLSMREVIEEADEASRGRLVSPGAVTPL